MINSILRPAGTTLVLLVVLMGFAGCSSVTEKGSMGTTEEFNLVPKERSDLKRRALNEKDAIAAMRLGDYYIYTKNNVVEGLKWYRLAADYGDPVAKNFVKSYKEASGWTRAPTRDEGKPRSLA